MMNNTDIFGFKQFRFFKIKLLNHDYTVTTRTIIITNIYVPIVFYIYLVKWQIGVGDVDYTHNTVLYCELYPSL